MSQVIEVRRVEFGEKATIGEMYGPDGDFWCHTLEDHVRRVKVKGQTAIPAGDFEMVLSWSPRYARIMPRLLSVPYFDGILIHPGNTAEDSEGCILVGKYDPKTPGFISASRDAFDRIFPLMRKLTEKDEVRVRVNGGFEAGAWELAGL